MITLAALLIHNLLSGLEGLCEIHDIHGCPPFLASELAAVVPCRENSQSTHWFYQMMFTGLFQSDAQILCSHHYIKFL